MRQVMHLIPVLLILLARAATAADVVHDNNQGTRSYRIPLDTGTAGEWDWLDIEAGLHRTIMHHDPDQTPSDILRMHWQALSEDGYREIFRCHDRTCGGIDFRRNIEVASFPEMFVNLGDYQYLAAANDQDGYIVLLASRSNSTGFLQIDRLGTAASDGNPLPEANHETERTSSFGDRLTRDGHSILEGLRFASGSDKLVKGNYPVLAELALWMQDNPGVAIALVGHTDNAGSLERNRELSVLRAKAVLDRMINEYGINEDRVSAHGIGFLAPLTTNDTEAGRNINRRVEVVLISIP